MANNYLQFSFVIRELTPELSGAIEEGLQLATANEDEPDCGGLSGTNWTFSKEGEELWVRAGEYGDPGAIAEVIQDALAKVGSHRAIGFTWAETCSKMHEDEFSGGGVFITKDEIKWFIPGQLILDEVNKRKEET